MTVLSDRSNSLDNIFQDEARKILVCKDEINLSTKNENTIFILFVEESKGSAGGRIGGGGFRRISRVVCYQTVNGVEKKIFETQDDNVISNFDIPLSAVAMDIELSNGIPKVVQGIVDEELINSYLKLIQ